MRFYNIDSSLSFGQYQGKTLKEVARIDPGYLEYCALEVSQFYLTDELVEELENIAGDFSLSPEARVQMDTNLLPDDWEDDLKEATFHGKNLGLDDAY